MNEKLKQAYEKLGLSENVSREEINKRFDLLIKRRKSKASEEERSAPEEDFQAFKFILDTLDKQEIEEAEQGVWLSTGNSPERQANGNGSSACTGRMLLYRSLRSLCSLLPEMLFITTGSIVNIWLPASAGCQNYVPGQFRCAGPGRTDSRFGCRYYCAVSGVEAGRK